MPLDLVLWSCLLLYVVATRDGDCSVTLMKDILVASWIFRWSKLCNASYWDGYIPRPQYLIRVWEFLYGMCFWRSSRTCIIGDVLELHLKPIHCSEVRGYAPLSRLDACTQTDDDQSSDSYDWTGFLSGNSARACMPPPPSQPAPLPPMVISLVSALAMDEDDKTENEGNENSCKSQVSSGAVSMASEHENSCKSSSIPTDEQLQRYQRDFISAYEQQLTKMQQETFEIMHAQLRNLLDKQAAREDRLVTQIQSLARSQGDICKDQALLRQSLGALASNSDNSLTNAKHVSTSAELERGEFVKGLMQRTICESVNEIFTERFKQGDQPCSFQSMLDRDA